MDSYPQNPSSNKLPPGMTDDQVEQAVRQSGYPLQTVVALELVSNFTVVEEWGYVDRTTAEHRTLDLLAFRELDPSPTITPQLSLLIECKRSDRPYVFFAQAIPGLPLHFPALFGFARNTFSVRRRDGTGLELTPSEFFQVSDFDFVTKPSVATAFSRLERKGKKLEVSGDMPFNNIVLPLVSALDHYRDLFSPGQRTHYRTIIAMCVSVVDAPMLVARGTPEHPELRLEPWIRVVRQEAVRDGNSWRRKFYAIDVVHREFLSVYVAAHVLPFAVNLAARILSKELPVTKGMPVSSDRAHWPWD